MAGELQKELREVNSFQAPYANDVVLKRCHAAADALDAAEKALDECLKEHGGFTIRGECERNARAALAKLRGEA